MIFWKKSKDDRVVQLDPVQELLLQNAIVHRARAKAEFEKAHGDLGKVVRTLLVDLGCKDPEHHDVVVEESGKVRIKKTPKED